MPVFHPRKNDQGRSVCIARPTQPSASATWHDPNSIAVFTPESPTPDLLNGVSLSQVTTPLAHSDWLALVSAIGDEPSPLTKPGKRPSAGVVIVETDGRVWACEPTNHYAGYDLTFPKGTVEADWSLAATAAREAFEETGLLVKIEKFLVDVERSASRARYYLGTRRGGTPAAMGWEMQSVRLIPQMSLNKEITSHYDARILKVLSRVV